MERGTIIQYYVNLHRFLKREKFIERELKIKEIPNKIISLIGPRRAGKTFYMLNLMRKRFKRSIYFDFEIGYFRELIFKEIMEIIKLDVEYFNSKVEYIFFDEIQSLEHWQNIVRSFENMEYHIFISGSSSKLLSKEISTALRGRKISYTIFPLSYKEFLKCKMFPMRKYYAIEEIVKIKKLLEEYLSYGSFPEIALKEEKELILKEYKDLIFFKDFIERFSIEHIEVAKFIFEFLLQNFSKEMSINKVSNFVTQKLKENKKNLV